MWVRILVQEDPLEEGMATRSSILAWRIPWTEEPGGIVHGVAKSWTRLSDLAHTHMWDRPSTPSPPAVPGPLTWDAEKQQSWGQPHGPASGLPLPADLQTGKHVQVPLTLRAVSTGRLLPSARPDRLYVSYSVASFYGVSVSCF